MSQVPGQATAADVFYAYRLLLGREPDRIGLLEIIERVSRERLSVDELRDVFTTSPEFTSKANSLTRVPMSDGLSVFVDPGEPDFGRAIAQSGSWEPHVAAEILNHVEPGDVVVDVGANVGIMSFKIAQAVGSAGKVISFEPNPRNVQSFLRGVTDNRFSNIDLYPFAMSDRREVFALAGGSNSHLTSAGEGGLLIQSYVGDDILSRESRIDFIKLDIEGHEPAALRGLSQTVQRHRPIILCEFNPRCLRAHGGILPREFAEQLFEISPQCTAIEYDGARNVVSDVTTLMELWAERNARAVEGKLLPDGMLHFDLLLGQGRKFRQRSRPD